MAKVALVDVVPGENHIAWAMPDAACQVVAVEKRPLDGVEDLGVFWEANQLGEGRDSTRLTCVGAVVVINIISVIAGLTLFGHLIATAGRDGFELTPFFGTTCVLGALLVVIAYERLGPRLAVTVTAGVIECAYVPIGTWDAVRDGGAT